VSIAAAGRRAVSPNAKGARQAASQSGVPASASKKPALSGMRINRFLARCGIASRREADALVAAGRVAVNGQPAAVGAVVDPIHDQVSVDGRVVRPPAEPPITLVFHKPRGVVTTMADERGRKCVADFVPRGRGLFPVGRLDADTTGLLLVTNDGELAAQLLHPRYGVPRHYEVDVAGEPRADQVRLVGARRVRRLPHGVARLFVVLREGRNREVRRLCAGAGLRVLALKRTAFGPVRLGGLPEGAIRALTARERLALQATLHEKKTVAPQRTS
jgi:23S rRNA pseudouridine2605 synthase